MAINYTKEQIISMVKEGVRENVNLDYKSVGALTNNQHHKDEISKDVSGFANSDGGVLIYGIREEDHIPQSFDAEPEIASKKEWIEQVINSNIKPRISGIIVNPVEIDEDHSVLLVRIPSSNTAHQANDHRYYHRYGSETLPMEDYQVKQTINRGQEPILMIESPEKKSYFGRANTQQRLHLTLKNNGKVTAKAPLIFVHIPTDLNPTFQGKWKEIKSDSRLIRHCTKYWLEWDNIMDIPLHPHFPMNISGNGSEALAIQYLPRVFDDFEREGYYEIYAENMMPKFGILRFKIVWRNMSLEINEIETLPTS